ncbi:MAG TPA: pitrilysin family protein [Gemmatimonadales bacterium]
MTIPAHWTRGLVREVLPNGLTLLVQRDDSSPAASIVTHVEAGFFDEPDEWVGVSHVLEHMFFKGTPTRGVGAIARETKAAGGYLNAHTAYDHTAYFVVLPASALATGLEIQADALLHPLVDEAELARELKVIIEEAKRKLDTPSAVAHETLHEVLFDRHRIRRWRIGTEAQLAGYRRADIHGYYLSRYVPERTIVSIVGNVEPEAALAMARERYGAWAPRPGAVDRSPAEPDRRGVRVRTLRGDVTQSELSLGWRAPGPLHPDAAALDVAMALLGAGRGSSLYRRLREPGIVTSVSAHYYAPTELGVIAINAELEPERVGDAVTGIAEAVAQLAMSGPREDDLFRARTLLLSRWARRLEPTEGRAMALASAEALDGAEHLDREYAELERVTADRVREAAARWLVPDSPAGVAYHPDERGADLDADTVAAAFAVTALTPVAAVPHPQAPAQTAARTGALRRDRVAGVHHFELPGADLLVRAKRGVPMVTLGAYVAAAPTSVRAEAGLTMLAMRAAARGAGGMDSAALAFAFERLGGTLVTSVSSDWAGAATTVLADALPEAARLLHLVLAEPSLVPADVEAERRILTAQAEQVADDMFRYPIQLAFAAAFGESGYGLPIGGLPDTIPELDLRQVRTRAEALARGRLTVIAVGELEPDRAAEELAGVFGHHPASAPPAPGARQAWSGTSPLQVQERARAQSALAMVFPGPHRRSRSRHAADVWAAVASGLGGRLFEALRDRRSLAYTVVASAWQRRCAGALVTYIATSPEREDEAREQMLGELERFAREPIGADELARAAQYLAGQAEVHRQTSGSVAGEILEAWMAGEGLAELADPAAAFRRVTAEEVRALAEESVAGGRRVEAVIRGVEEPMVEGVHA